MRPANIENNFFYKYLISVDCSILGANRYLADITPKKLKKINTNEIFSSIYKLLLTKKYEETHSTCREPKFNLFYIKNTAKKNRKLIADYCK